MDKGRGGVRAGGPFPAAALGALSSRAVRDLPFTYMDGPIRAVSLGGGGPQHLPGSESPTKCSESHVFASSGNNSRAPNQTSGQAWESCGLSMTLLHWYDS